LLLLAYTNRFLAIARLARTLHAKYKEKPDSIILEQIRNLRQRISRIRNMQIFGIFSLLLSVVCMFLLYIEWIGFTELLFGIALILLIASLALSVWEIQISTKALNLHLIDIEEH
jgi:hypothetical protein